MALMPPKEHETNESAPSNPAKWLLIPAFIFAVYAIQIVRGTRDPTGPIGNTVATIADWGRAIGAWFESYA